MACSVWVSSGITYACLELSESEVKEISADITDIVVDELTPNGIIKFVKCGYCGNSKQINKTCCSCGSNESNN